MGTCYFRYRQITSKRERDSERKLFITDGSTPVSSYGELCMSSDTGSGLPALVSIWYSSVFTI